MTHLARRTFVVGAALLPVALFAPYARATMMRGLSLRALCAQSHHILLARAIEARCVSLPIAGRAMIVTETRVRVEDAFSRAAPATAELVVRTLGGELDGIGELVNGQAELSPGVPCLAFLTPAKDGSLWVTGMAQGHYPLLSAAGSEPTLSASPRLPTLANFEHSAVRGLVGQSLTRARDLIARESVR